MNSDQLSTAADRDFALTVQEAASRLRVSRRFLENQIKGGRLRVVRLSPRCVRVRSADLGEYVERHAV